jgi:hypothetical protein
MKENIAKCFRHIRYSQSCRWLTSVPIACSAMTNQVSLSLCISSAELCPLRLRDGSLVFCRDGLTRDNCYRHVATVCPISDTIVSKRGRLKLGNACYHSVQNLLSSSLLSKNLKIKIYRTIILPIVLYGCKTWSLIFREELRLTVCENRVLRRVFGPKRD